VLVQGDLVTLEYLPDALFQDAPPSAAAGEHPASLEDVEREQIVRVLAESPTLEDAAETLGINVSTLWRKRKRYKIE
jgi:NtrC-family two-component system response regulator AlgB